ncbi:MAG TPA: hypothetical protein GXX36_16580, partial [Clostridiaceae bacterium]|nr:hypothetical protein [Clostridiaceae bacterium]
MRRSKLKPILSIILTVMLLLGVIPAQIAFAEPTRVAAPPPGAPDDAIFAEGETGTYGIDAGT